MLSPSLSNRFLIDGLNNVSYAKNSKLSKPKQSLKIGAKDFRKKTGSVEPPDSYDVDYNFANKDMRRSKVKSISTNFHDIILPNHNFVQSTKN